ncbi:hypothetical protein FQP87_03705 [Vibrio tasmaniensis]|nr:hypothetical protein FQP87_03705 [Vibrio tasmaniensis]
MKLSKVEIKYYSRHFSLPKFSEEKQLSLKKSRVLVIGAGGLGSPCILYLSGAGVGTIGIIDGDKISVSNLPRQVIYDFKSIELNKAEQATERASNLNPYIKINTYSSFLNSNNIEGIFSGYDIVVDCTDNFSTKFLIDETCEKMKKTLVYSSIFQFEGQVSVFHLDTNKGCNFGYRDLFLEPPSKEFQENCNDAGVVGTLPGILGTLQANEVIKIITGLGDILNGKVLVFDALSCRSSLLTLKKRKKKNAQIMLPKGLSLDETKLDINVNDLIKLYSDNQEFVLIDVRDSEEREISSIGGQHIPIKRLPENLSNIRKDLPIVIYCKTGIRSKRAVMYLIDENFSNVMSLQGGIMNITDSNITSLLKLNENPIRL